MSPICGLQLDHRPGALADSSIIRQFGSGHLGNCGYTRCFSLRVPAELCQASKASKGRHCCSKAIAFSFSRHNPELGIRPNKRATRRCAPLDADLKSSSGKLGAARPPRGQSCETPFSDCGLRFLVGRIRQTDGWMHGTQRGHQPDFGNTGNGF